uniref:S1 motif domain-containing protein n=1 Tax=Meloidogyne hapla TaxID=6305 RepID=A0A1I8BCR1_MELHA
MCTEVDFPRGGSSKLQASLQTDWKEAVKQSRGLKRNSSNNIQDLSKKTPVENDDEGYADVFRQNMSIELLSQNTRGLAFVKFIGEIDVTLECIDGIRLTLPADKISRIFNSQMSTTRANLNNIFHRGQALAFTVVNEKSGNNVNSNCVVSICPYEVNNYLIPSSLLQNTVLNGIVSSIEEKGAIVDLGFSSSSVKGFVQAEHLPSYLQLDKLFIGQVALFSVRERPNKETRVIKLTGFVGLDALDGNDNFDQKQLMPGTIVQVTPEKNVLNGLFVSIKNGQKAYIRKIHLPPRLRLDSSQVLKPFRACVVCIQPHSSMLVLNAHPDIIALSKLEKRLLPDSKFTIGSEHSFRVIGYSSMERQLNVSMKKSDMKQSVFSVETAVPCAKLNGTIKSIRDNGIIVEFGDGCTGFVCAMHVLDKPLEKWQTRFKKGQKLLCRVLFIDSTSNKVMLTSKSSLVKKPGNEKFITNFDRNIEGAISTGVIIKHLEGGSLLIAFFNRITGLMRPNELLGLPEAETQVGCCIKVRVQSVDPTLSQMLLEQPIRAIGIETKKQKKTLITNSQKIISLPKLAKPFRIYTAQVIGPWPYGGTSSATTAELLLPGGSVGRLHVCELNDLSDYSEGSFPMQLFLEQNTGKTINIKVLSVSKRKAFPVKGKRLLEERRKSDRIVECTARCDKLQESRRKLSILNYRSVFNPGNVVAVFIVSKSSNTTNHIFAEINPDFTAIISRENIKINSKLDLQNSEVSIDDMFDNGELRFGKVIGVNKTNRGRIVVLELVDASNCVLDEEPTKNETIKVTAEYKDDSSDGNTLIEDSDDDDETVEEEESEIAEGSGSAREFEQILLTSPNSISHWIGYIMFMARKSTSKKNYTLGKDVAERALKTIAFESDNDLNRIWRAYLHLEVLLGNEKSLKECFKRACAATDPLKTHKYLIDLLKKQPNAEGREMEIRRYFESLIKKSNEIEAWFAFARHLLQQNDSIQILQLLRRAIQCTEKRKHLQLIKGFARLEAQFGDVERSKTMQELIKNYKEVGKQIDVQSLERALGARIEQN